MIFQANENDLTRLLQPVRLLLLDVDGILTDGKLFFTSSGEEMKAFSTLDGHGIKMLRSTGVDVGIITGRTSKILERRASDLGISILYQGREDKLNALEEICSEREITPAQIAYAGDDLPDLPVLLTVAAAFSVPGAHEDIKQRVMAITTSQAGAGAVREICDFIMRSQGNYDQFLEAGTRRSSP